MPDFSHLSEDTLAGSIALILAGNEELTAMVDNRILSFDPRTVGWDLTPDNVSLWTPEKKLRLCIIVDDNGGSPPFLGPRQGSSMEIMVWVMGGPWRNNARDIPKIMDIIRHYLPNKQVMGGPIISWSFAIGLTPTDGGFMARNTFRVDGVFKH